jgi:hypothetical protein
MLVACAINFAFLGKNVSGWAWVAGLVAAAGVLWRHASRVSMPMWIWLPWGLLVTVYSLGHHSYALQSSAQILSPIIVGLAASCMRPGEVQLEQLGKLMRLAAVVFLGILLFLRVPMLLLGMLPEVTGLAAEAITALALQSFFLCAYLQHRNRKDLVLYLACAMVPVVALIRGPMAATFALVVLTISPLSIFKRLLIVVVAVFVGLAVLQTERVQHKMFWSGQGTIRDLRWDNPDLMKSGRDTLSDILWEGIPEHPWLGHGANAFLDEFRANDIGLEQVHNDWLRILYCYGYVGVVLFALAVSGQCAHAWDRARRARPWARALLLASATAFIPFAVVMVTDNVLVYAQFFGNVHFLLLGLAYGAVAREDQSRDRSSRALKGPKPRRGNTRSSAPTVAPAIEVRDAPRSDNGGNRNA